MKNNFIIDFPFCRVYHGTTRINVYDVSEKVMASFKVNDSLIKINKKIMSINNTKLFDNKYENTSLKTTLFIGKILDEFSFKLIDIDFSKMNIISYNRFIKNIIKNNLINTPYIRVKFKDNDKKYEIKIKKYIKKVEDNFFGDTIRYTIYKVTVIKNKKEYEFEIREQVFERDTFDMIFTNIENILEGGL